MRHPILVTTHVAHRQRRRGLTIIYVAMTLLVLVGLVGLAADTAYVFLTGQQLQAAADAAALAGAQEVGFSPSTAVTNAVSIAAANAAANAAVLLNSASDVQVGNYVRGTATFTANATPYNACKVTARRTTGSLGGPLNLIFGPGFGTFTCNVTRSAIAMADIGTAGYGLIVLASSGSTVLLSGEGSGGYAIVVTGAGMAVDSNSSSAILWSGNPHIAATTLSITGNDTTVNTGGIYTSGTALLNRAVVPDPYAAMVAPAKPAAGISNAPGYYASGFNLSSGTVTFTSGIYWIDGGITLSGSAAINATAGCLIYLHTGGITMSGSSALTYAPMPSGTYAGFSIYEDQANSSAMALSGSSGVTNAGILYLPAAGFAFSGTSESIGSQLLCKSLTMSGTTQININSSSLNGPSHAAFLVK